VVQLYQSELKDLCRFWLEPYHDITVETKKYGNSTATFAAGAKEVNISSFL